MFVWGYGILGKGPNLDQSNEPVKLPPPLFGCNEFNPDTTVQAMLQSILTEICLCGGKIGLSLLALAISKTSISLSRSALAARSKKSVLVWSTQLFCANLGHKYWAVYVLGTKFKFLWKFNTRFLKLVLLRWFVSASLVTKIYFLFFNHIDVI